MRFVLPYFLFLVTIVFQSNAQGFFDTVEKKFTQYKSSAPKERIQIITDRDLYAPGDLIWMDATIFDIHSPQISELSNALKIVLKDQKSIELFEKTFKAEKGGSNGFIQIPEGVLDGVYFLHGATKFSSLENSGACKIVIKQKILPPFLIKASFQGNNFIPGDQFNLTLEFLDYYNEPKRNVEYSVNFYDGNKRISGSEGKTKKTGLATVNINIPPTLKSGNLSYKVSAECKGIETSLAGRIPVLTDDIYMDFFPENGKLINALESQVSFFAYDGSGSPLAIEADLLENGQSIQTLVSDPDGTGSFKIVPDIERKYELQIKRPLLLDKKLAFPPIEAKGIGFEVITKSGENVTYQLVNGYQSTRLVYLVGVSDGEIFWKSEHELDRTFEVEVDLTTAKGRLAHFIAINAAEKIEGEHILMIPGREPGSIALKSIETSTSIRGENLFEVELQHEKVVKVIFSAVNAAWIIPDLNNQKCQSMGFPVDFHQHLIFNSDSFNKTVYSDQELEKYIKYYVPQIFSWDKVLNTREALKKEKQIKINPDLDLLAGNYYVEISEGRIRHHNLNLKSGFGKENPKFVASLYREKKKVNATYKELLANGTPVMDVLQVIKPYSLEGTNIVFMSSAISISSPSGALIIIDGINSGTSATVIQGLDPLDVESISVSTEAAEIQRYTSFNTAGVIEIVLKDGTTEENEEEASIQDQDAKFSAPEYKRGKSGPEDFRSTLYWKVSSLPVENGKEIITFYNSDLISEVRGAIYIIPKQGIPIKTNFEYRIK